MSESEDVQVESKQEAKTAKKKKKSKAKKKQAKSSEAAPAVEAEVEAEAEAEPDQKAENEEDNIDKEAKQQAEVLKQIEAKKQADAKKKASLQFKVKYYLPKSTHYQLIGKDGAVQQRLESDFNVLLDIPKSYVNSTEVIVSAKDLAAAAALEKEITAVLNFKPSHLPLKNAFLYVPQDKWSALIGDDEVVLNEIEKTANVNVEFIPKADEKGKDYLLIEGASDQDINKAKDIINKKLGGKEVKVAPTPVVEAKSAFVKKPIQPSAVEINDVLFFPDRDLSDGHNLDIFLKYLASANKTIDVCVYHITHDDIYNILAAEHKSGTKIRIISDNDKEKEPGSDVARLAKLGVPVLLDTSDACMHHKFAIVDNALLLNGSFNWTTSAAQRNNENVVVTNDPAFVKSFVEHFEKMWNDKQNFAKFKA